MFYLNSTYQLPFLTVVLKTIKIALLSDRFQFERYVPSMINMYTSIHTMVTISNTHGVTTKAVAHPGVSDKNVNICKCAHDLSGFALQ